MPRFDPRPCEGATWVLSQAEARFQVSIRPCEGATWASTVNGDINSDFEMSVRGRISRRRVEGTIGAGGRTLSLETVNGGITLKRE